VSRKQWWTVSAVYDDNEQSYVDHFEASTWQDAWKKALHKADGVIRKSAIFAGKLEAVDFDAADSVVPIRGKAHRIEVVRVNIVTQHVLIPGRCPHCKKDLRRPRALVETYFITHQWLAHLAHDDTALSSERDGTRQHINEAINAARLTCAACNTHIWDGLHVA
jgi:hypothetical protein